jgi:hypothetical protein
MKRTPAAVIGITFCALLLTSCSDNSTEPNLDDIEIETDLADPSAVIQAFEEAHRLQDFEAYAALLDEEFEFVPLEFDADDLPWLAGDSWGRSEELTMIGHLFDPTFSGEQDPIDVIECDLTVITNTAGDSGERQIRCTMQGRAMTSATDGWSFDTVLDITLLQDGFSHWRLRRIAEVQLGRASPDFPQLLTWGRIKSMFRDPLPGGGNP